LTPVYLQIAEAAALAAEAGGATVARAYSPEATPDRVLSAVADANIVVYLGHGVGTPNPYGATDPAGVNGWGLQGPAARGTHEDSWQDGTLAYYGEAWIAANAKPAPGWVMIYSNACYAPGASEGFDGPATAEQAQARVSGYARTPLDILGASAYFATDFYAGAAQLITTMLQHPDWTYGQIYAADPHFSPDALTALPAVAMSDLAVVPGLAASAVAPGSVLADVVPTDVTVPGREVWLHQSPYFDNKVEYWYAFAGDPNLTPADTMLARAAPLGSTPRTVSGVASAYGEQPGWEGIPTVALPLPLGGITPGEEPGVVIVCGARCVELPIVDSCPCYYGTPEERIANLSSLAWSLVNDGVPGIAPVELYFNSEPEGRPVLRPRAAPGAA
jgi:hypothetical protein